MRADGTRKRVQLQLQRAGLVVGPGMLEYTDKDGQRRTWRHDLVVMHREAGRVAA